MVAPRRIDRPEPGYWLVRLVKGGPLVPAAIILVHTTHEPGDPSNLMDRSPFLAAYIAGDPVRLVDVWERRGDQISRADYEYRLADIRWAKEHAPNEAIANLRRPIDLATLPLPF